MSGLNLVASFSTVVAVSGVGSRCACFFAYMEGTGNHKYVPYGHKYARRL